MARVINGTDELNHLVGQELGTSPWLEVTQHQVDLFADATGDHQWIHVDPERARSGPFGGPIAHGYLTMSLIPGLLNEVMTITGFSMGVNYGLNKMRFPAPVPVGRRVRLHAHLLDVANVRGGVQTTLRATVEVEDGDKPGCVADVIYLWRP